MTDVSVIISFYNKISNLKFLLAGFERQSFKSFEVIIADDGSKQEVVEEIEQIESNYSFSIQHAWHKDKGWRKNMIMNLAITKAKGNYLVFVDGDCIPHKHFVREHFYNRSKRTILTGRRVYLSEEFSKTLNSEKIENGYLEPISTHIKNSSHQWENGLFVPRNMIIPYLSLKDNKKGILGCNFSAHKESFLEINGFDERYEKPCVGEDTDVEYRFKNAGYRIRLVKHLAIQYHIYHKLLSRDGEEENMKILQENIDGKITWTPYGINKESDS